MQEQSLISGRKASLPSANEIKKARDFLPIAQRADLLRNYVGLKVCWPGILVGAQTRADASEFVSLHFRFDSEETNGALFRCQVKVAEYPVIEVAKEKEARAWVHGEIAGIEDSYVTLTNATVEFQ